MNDAADAQGSLCDFDFVCVCFSGEELEYHLKDLRPATDYHVR